MLGWRRGEAKNRDRGGRTRARLVALSLIACLWALGILIRLVYLQVVSSRIYQEAADGQQLRAVRLDASRGAILDRWGHILAMTAPVDSDAINPQR
ncbi:MAG: hypothetical protein ABSD56_03545, partial [Bryobacteraceae bacterium]